MKIYHIYIKGYKNLKDFKADFDASHTDITTVLVGQNATGKSNFLEAIVYIFRSLFLYEKVDFYFDIEYECRGKKIKIIADPDPKAKRMQYWVDNIAINQTQFQQYSGKDRTYKLQEVQDSLFENNDLTSEIPNYLPDHIFAYYSGLGNNDRLENLFDRFQEMFRNELLDGKRKDADKEIALPFLFFAKLIHSYFALLSFYAYNNEDAREAKQFLKDTARIEDLDSLLFIVRQKLKGSSKFPEHKESSPKFWNARGEVAKFLEALYDKALAPIRRKINIRLGEFSDTTKQAVYLYLPTVQDLQDLAANYNGEADFFKYLNSMYMSDLLEEIQVFIRKPDTEDDLSFKDLSEGEQQLLVVLGLLRFFRQKECLFLLDEPDTHLNPMWKYHYLHFLRKISGQSPKSQIFMTTHEALVVNGLKKESIKIFRRNSDGLVEAHTPDKDMIGSTIEEILKSETFGLTTTLDRVTYDKVLRKAKIYQLLKNQKIDIEEKKSLQKEVQQLELELEEFGL